jgi:hypothetical protein
MSAIEKKVEKLEAAKNRLRAKELELRLQEKKDKDRKIFQVGKLAYKANLTGMDTEALFGALLEISEKINNPESLKKWRERAASVTDNVKEKGDSIAISFESTPSSDAKNKLKELGLRYNKFRNEWNGYVSKEEAKTALEKFGAIVNTVS